MKENKPYKKFGFHINPRPWYEWAAWGIWIIFEVFFIQNAIVSGEENEPRAELVYWMIFVTLFISGVVTYISRQVNAREESEQNGE